MVGNYPVITLCGSTRFKDAFLEAQKRLTLEGYIVISVGLFGHSGDAEVWENMPENTVTRTKAMLDDMHKRKIDMADEIYVLNVNDYIGQSTRGEIDYARAHGKIVRFLEPHVDDRAGVDEDRSASGDDEEDTEQDAAAAKEAYALQMLQDGYDIANTAFFIGEDEAFLRAVMDRNHITDEDLIRYQNQ